ncbi:hypothetical protein [Mangrovicoccus algicola]|uniref:Sulfotransferase family protein n=1 Tax=Mangrovicoccus algicola TaxID=2771008 RepID=A0A8J7CUF9_9RHOB|nr:hypothetical protein [Mangrovicoccus algicola]MBE3637439.1 hypothetical protein [Mangrovicoccus algicola]
MVQVLFHIGMGKTGTTSIQAALDQSDAALQKSSCSYLGMWMDFLGREFSGPGGFANFLALDPKLKIRQAEKFYEYLLTESKRGATEKFIISNEGFLTRLNKMKPFFKRLEQLVELRLVAYARPVKSWLPSACSQWGVLHKTNSGPIENLHVAGERMISQYSVINDWDRLFGKSFCLRQFDSGKDILEDFSQVIGVKISAGAKKRQVRLPVAEQMLRASFNNQVQGISLPKDFDEIIKGRRGGDLPSGLEEKFEFLFDYSSLAPVIEKHKSEIQAIEKKFGLDLMSGSLPEMHEYREREIINFIVGNLMDIVSSHALEIERLKAKIEELESFPNTM